MLRQFRYLWQNLKQTLGVFSIAISLLIINTNAAAFAAPVADNSVNNTNIFAHLPTPGAVAPATSATPSLNSTDQPNANHSNAPNTANMTPPALAVNGYYLQDVYSGKMLAALNPDQRTQIASLTKLMTLYLIFEALDAGRIHLNDQVPISQNAWKTGGSRMFVQVGTTVPAQELINGIIVDSGNDACVAMAEHIAGTESSFVNLMNQQAGLLGMQNTHFMDATGLPNPEHYSSPHDLAILARAIILNFPQYYPLFSQKDYSYNNITQENRNPLFKIDPAVDGLKTGHTDEAGYCLVASAKRDDMRLLSVVLGAPTPAARAQGSESLLSYGFNAFETHKTYTAHAPIQLTPVWFGRNRQLSIGVSNDVYLTVPSGQYQDIDVQMQIDHPLKAPINKGQKVGTLTAVLNGKTLASENLVALENMPQGGFFKRVVDHFKLAMTKST